MPPMICSKERREVCSPASLGRWSAGHRGAALHHTNVPSGEAAPARCASGCAWSSFLPPTASLRGRLEGGGALLTRCQRHRLPLLPHSQLVLFPPHPSLPRLEVPRDHAEE